MNSTQYLNLKKIALNILLQDKVKEYSCHVQFVAEIALGLARELKVDRKVIEIAALLHDIGRGQELENEKHEEAGARIAGQIFQDVTPDLLEKETILSCIRHHNNKVPVRTVEEKIIASADGASKVIYHQAFMLMCKKEDFIERTKWGLEYLEKGMKGISISALRIEAAPFYRKYSKIYHAVLRNDNLSNSVYDKSRC